MLLEKLSRLVPHRAESSILCSQNLSPTSLINSPSHTNSPNSSWLGFPRVHVYIPYIELYGKTGRICTNHFLAIATEILFVINLSEVPNWELTPSLLSTLIYSNHCRTSRYKTVSDESSESGPGLSGSPRLRKFQSPVHIRYCFRSTHIYT